MNLLDTNKAVWLAFGRQVRPGSLALTVATAGLGVNAVLHRTQLYGAWETVAGIVGMLAAGLLIAGWWAQSLTAAAIGYLCCLWLWLFVAGVAAQQAADPLMPTVINACAFALLAGGLWMRDRRET